MSDAGEKKASEAGEQKAANSKTWTEVQKLGLLFAIINSSCDKINWKEVKLPEGRSLKACQVWLDKQRTELKKLKEAAGENGEEDTPAKPPAKTPKKRGAKAAVEGEENGDEATPKPKKQRVTKKKTPAKVTAAADDQEKVESETPVAEEKVKAEAEDEDTNVEMN
ncbi:hypothetical protein CB0940_10753 [Cercospora beticola]|uniref:Uncharacterized protein n=1 Tax=Cercospora beticola TaxID=122368 RepID=A0A2G5HSV9_CERBT|nr:hypothetical protein CB0940_10753 [Cercospora beticola]PIA95621.1 hypothetical protein CB0940_10753 [Cercospora beticola]WPB07482.1 hypothetical protein RHO25_012143 [Cercospora beticola]